MYSLYNQTDNTKITDYAFPRTENTVLKAINTALNGEVYFQTFGNPATRIYVQAVIPTANKILLESADADGCLMALKTANGTLWKTGHIESVEFQPDKGHDILRVDIVLLEVTA